MVLTRTYADILRPAHKIKALAYDIALIVGASLLLSLSNFVIRIPLAGTPVPITGQTFAVVMLGALLGSKRAPAAVLLYLMYGLAGLPFYSGGALAGPTGGYLLGFIFAAFTVGFLCERGLDRRYHTAVAAMIVGNIVLYIPGIIWLSFYTPQNAIVLGLFPYIPGDILKLALASALLPTGWKLIGKIGNRRDTGRENDRPEIRE